MHGEQKAAKSFFPEKGIYLFIILITLFAGALAVRLYKVNAPPLDFHEVRQFHSFLISRSFYYTSLSSIPEAEKEAALAATPPLLEPPVIEYTTSLLYRIFGGEIMVIPRLMSILFWLISAVFLYLLARDSLSPDSAIIAMSYYLFLPYGVWASRSFQPDPLMMMLFLAASYRIFKYYRQPSTRNLVTASILGAAAAFIKPVVLFPLYGAFIAAGLTREGIRKTILGRDTIAFAVACAAPIIIYTVYAYFFAGFLKDQIGYRYIPDLYLSSTYWIYWYKLAVSVVGRWPLILALTGWILLRPGMTKSFLMGLWIGYVIFGLVFNVHIYTHDYYHLMLIPIVALSLSAAGSLLLERLATNNRISRLGFWILLVSIILLSMHTSVAPLSDSDRFHARIRTDMEIGDLIKHSKNTIYLDSYFGNRLEFYGIFAGIRWPRLEDIAHTVEAGEQPVRGKVLLDQLIKEKSPDYFVISSVDEIEGQQDLKETLESEYALVANNPQYIIYDLKRRNPSRSTP